MSERNIPIAEQIHESRINNVEKMHELVQKLNHEGAYEQWSQIGVPDCPNADDFEWFAEDDESYEELVGLFLEILEQYGKYGFVKGCVKSWRNPGN